MDDPMTLNPGPIDDSVLKLQHRHISREIWEKGTTKAMTLRSVAPVNVSNAIVLELLEQAGFGHLYEKSKEKVDASLITALVERWRQETHSFHLPVGEATITLQDIAELTHTPIDGAPISEPSRFTVGEWREMGLRYLGLELPNINETGVPKINKRLLKDHIRRSVAEIGTENTEENNNRAKQLTRCLILTMLSGTLMPRSHPNLIELYYLPFLTDFENISHQSWGSAILSALYRGLCRAACRPSGKQNHAVEICIPGFILQAWALKRMPMLHVIDHDDPDSFVQVHRDQISQMRDDQFIWEPYGDREELELPPYCGNNELWRAKVPLIWCNIVEWHLPDRVLRQFGMNQGIPVACDTDEMLHKLDDRAKKYVNWRTAYDRFKVTWDNRRNLVVQESDVGTDLGRYMDWYRRITRTLIAKPRIQNTHDEQSFDERVEPFQPWLRFAEKVCEMALQGRCQDIVLLCKETIAPYRADQEPENISDQQQRAYCGATMDDEGASVPREYSPPRDTSPMDDEAPYRADREPQNISDQQQRAYCGATMDDEGAGVPRDDSPLQDTSPTNDLGPSVPQDDIPQARSPIIIDDVGASPQDSRKRIRTQTAAARTEVVDQAPEEREEGMCSLHLMSEELPQPDPPAAPPHPSIEQLVVCLREELQKKMHDLQERMCEQGEEIRKQREEIRCLQERMDHQAAASHERMARQEAASHARIDRQEAVSDYMHQLFQAMIAFHERSMVNPPQPLNPVREEVPLPEHQSVQQLLIRLSEELRREMHEQLTEMRRLLQMDRQEATSHERMHHHEALSGYVHQWFQTLISFHEQYMAIHRNL